MLGLEMNLFHVWCCFSRGVCERLQMLTQQLRGRHKIVSVAAATTVRGSNYVTDFRVLLVSSQVGRGKASPMRQHSRLIWTEKAPVLASYLNKLQHKNIFLKELRSLQNTPHINCRIAFPHVFKNVGQFATLKMDSSVGTSFFFCWGCCCIGHKSCCKNIFFLTLLFRSLLYCKPYNIPLPINKKVYLYIYVVLPSQQDQSGARNCGSATICHKQAGRTKGNLLECICVNVLSVQGQLWVMKQMQSFASVTCLYLCTVRAFQLVLERELGMMQHSV